MPLRPTGCLPSPPDYRDYRLAASAVASVGELPDTYTIPEQQALPILWP